MGGAGEAGTDTRAFLTITSQTAVPVAVGAVATRAARRVRLTGNHQAPGSWRSVAAS